ncbi:hypothetical protein Lal_00010880 [Lupinus albus]|nr:hypothetical protein Lal_00010880 [Lupinus albus]
MAVCANEDCDWIAYCSWDTKLSTYQIKIYNPEHTCCRTFQNKSASRGWVAKRLEARLLAREGIAESEKNTMGNCGITLKKFTRQTMDQLLQWSLFICLNACKEGFKNGCRPMIGLDSCFLKGYYGGQLLSAVGQDANNQFYIIAYVVMDSETKDN